MNHTAEFQDQREVELKIASECEELFNLYSSSASSWRNNAQENREFRLGKQWTQEQIDVLEARGQTPSVVNRIHPAVESGKAIMSAKGPTFKISPREDSDNKVATVIGHLMSYCYDISNGVMEMRQIIDDYYVAGLGWAYAYQDPSADMGKGEVKFMSLDPMDVYVDPNSRNRFFDDAEHILISRMFTQAQANAMWAEYLDKTTQASGNQNTNYPSSGRAGTSDNPLFFPQDVQDNGHSVKLRGHLWFTKIEVPAYRVFETFSGRELLLNDQDFAQYKNNVAFKYNGHLLWEDADINKAQQQISNFQMSGERQRDIVMQDAELKKSEAVANLTEMQAMIKQAVDSQAMMPERADVELQKAEIEFQRIVENIDNTVAQQLMQFDQLENGEKVPFTDLIKLGQIQVVKVPVPRIRMRTVLGNKFLEEKMLQIEHYPVIPFSNLFLRTPYPASDVQLVKSTQEVLNKVRSVILHHAATTGTGKVLLPEGIDVAEFEREWARTGVGIRVPMEDGQVPIPWAPPPLANEFYRLEDQLKADIDHTLGVYELMMGNAQGAHPTHRGVLTIDEFGQRKIRSKLSDIEVSMKRLGEVMLALIQQHYSAQKIFRLVTPNNSLSSFVINNRLYDDATGEVSKIENDITIGRYDVIVETGSSMPSNRYAELETYMGAYEKGLIDRQEALKKIPIFDMEGVIERIGEIQQLTRQVEELDETVNNLKGDMQTKDREIQSLRNKVEVEKAKTDINRVTDRAEMKGQLFDSRLQDLIGKFSSDLEGILQSKKQGDTRTSPKKKKGSPKKEH